MLKIGVWLIAVNIIGFTNADEAPKCQKFPKIMNLHKCCYQIEIVSHAEAFDYCSKKYENTSHPEYCASSCLLNQTGIGNSDGSMNLTAYHNYLVDKVKDDELIAYMTNIIQSCEKEINKTLKNTQCNNDESQPCGLHGNLLLQCAANYGIRNCPAQKWKANDDYCNNVLNEAKSCVGSETSGGLLNIDISLFIDLTSIIGLLKIL